MKKIIYHYLIIFLIIIFFIFLIFKNSNVNKAEAKIFQIVNQHTYKKAMYWEKIDNNIIRCNLCPNRCVLQPSQIGICLVRKNIDGELKTLVHSLVCAVHIDPIEKKPFFHFLPNTGVLSIATAGCNVRCKFCQNWEISQVAPEEIKNILLPPEEVVKLAKENKTPSIAFTYTEPVVFYEYMLETAKLAKKAGIKTTMHTAGYINPEPLRELLKYLDGVNVDLKGFTEEFYQELTIARLEPILTALKIIKEEGVFLEITNLVIPTKNDDTKIIKKMCEWIKDNLGSDVPLHFSRFFPMHKLKNLPPTPVETLEKARKIALDCGLKYVYIGNVRGHQGENTYCHKCGKILIKRVGYAIIENNIVNGKCKFCGNKIPGVWQ